VISEQSKKLDLRNLNLLIGTARLKTGRIFSVFASTSRLDNAERRDDCSHLVSVLFFKRFLQRPFQIASIVPSSKGLVERVANKMDFSRPRVIAEYGPGEGVHSREIARRMSLDSHLLLFELDPAFSHDLERAICPGSPGACHSWRCGAFAV